MHKRITNKDFFEIIKNNILKSGKKEFSMDIYDGFSDLVFEEVKLANNGLAKSHKAYEEFENLIFIEKDTNETIEVNYHNLPYIIYDSDDETIFDISDYYEGETKIQIDFDFFSPLNDTNKSGCSDLDSDPKFLELFNKVRDLLRKPYKFLDGKDYRFDNQIYIQVENDLLKAYKEFLDYVTSKFKGKYEIVDLFEPNYQNDSSKRVFNKFTTKDFTLIREQKDLPILNKGSHFYTIGDYENAFPYYLAAALQGNVDAISNLGYCFMYGRSVEKNMDLAVACFMIASEKGSIDATYKLGTLYKYNEQLRDLHLSKKYFIEAMGTIKYSADRTYIDFPSLDLAIAKEKIEGKSFIKDILGAYLLLKFAYEGYKNDLALGFTPHQKQFNETVALLDDEMFDVAKKYYRENLEYSYRFGDYELTLEEYSSESLILIGDTVLSLVNRNGIHDDRTLQIHPGDKLIVKEMYDDYCLVSLVDGDEDILVAMSYDSLRK